jgi:hypothetical protein
LPPISISGVKVEKTPTGRLLLWAFVAMAGLVGLAMIYPVPPQGRLIFWIVVPLVGALFLGIGLVSNWAMSSQWIREHRGLVITLLLILGILAKVLDLLHKK